uniref:AIR12 DOMON domain-containing protein n=1 Tax=Aegilops tauschii TaxID=37682 RepID=R7WAI6_AEGTA
MKAVNHIWQVGTSVTAGAPDKHAFAAGNLASKSKLVLSGKAASATSPSPAPAPMAGGPSGSAGSDGGASATTAPSAGKSPSGAAAVGVSAPALLVLALMGLLAVEQMFGSASSISRILCSAVARSDLVIHADSICLKPGHRVRSTSLIYGPCHSQEFEI